MCTATGCTGGCGFRLPSTVALPRLPAFPRWNSVCGRPPPSTPQPVGPPAPPPSRPLPPRALVGCSQGTRLALAGWLAHLPAVDGAAVEPVPRLVGILAVGEFDEANATRLATPACQAMQAASTMRGDRGQHELPVCQRVWGGRCCAKPPSNMCSCAHQPVHGLSYTRHHYQVVLARRRMTVSLPSPPLPAAKAACMSHRERHSGGSGVQGGCVLRLQAELRRSLPVAAKPSPRGVVLGQVHVAHRPVLFCSSAINSDQLDAGARAWCCVSCLQSYSRPCSTQNHTLRTCAGVFTH